MKQNNPKQKKERVFRVTITETLKRTILVREGELKAPTPDDAAQTVSDWWHQGQIILEADDFTDVDFSAEEVREGGEDGE